MVLAATYITNSPFFCLIFCTAGLDVLCGDCIFIFFICRRYILNFYLDLWIDRDVVVELRCLLVLLEKIKRNILPSRNTYTATHQTKTPKHIRYQSRIFPYALLHYPLVSCIIFIHSHKSQKHITFKLKYNIPLFICINDLMGLLIFFCAKI